MQFCRKAVGLLLLATSVDGRLLGNGQSKTPLTSDEKQAVGQALTDALRAAQGHGSGSKYGACASLFPDGRAPADADKNPTWLACKDLVAPKRSALTAIASTGKEEPFTYSKKGYEEDWQTEHRSGKYPQEAEGKWHHPEYSEESGRDPHPGTPHHEKLPSEKGATDEVPQPKKSRAAGTGAPLVLLPLVALLVMRA
eukprot:TRINITY_DN74536_c0_g1_i1.p2 TRINITY_DN74536_c0_g1~~TRINITY_DN74536_c0_g1_i1.p2  ORF type:complete len:216 (-),score=46.08 TRINITY_DN74536_c0_g1_i1:144-734(-)